jgi:ubiquinone/menaquinone biosynthesis C-methylase UbiE
MGQYTIEQGLAVRDRMNLLAEAHGPGTAALLDRIRVGPGWRCVDVGCGGGHVTIDLAQRAGPSGFSLGLDLDAELLRAARVEASDRGLTNVEFRVARAEDLVESDLDLAYARFLLMHIEKPDDVVGAMASAVKPDGVVVLEDCDFSACFTYPSCDAYDTLVGWYVTAVASRGGNAQIGQRLPEILRHAGLELRGLQVSQPAFVSGRQKHLVEVSMDKSRSAVVDEGLASGDEYEIAHKALIEFTNDPTTLVSAPRIIQAWAVRTT